MTAKAASSAPAQGQAWSDRDATVCGVDLSGFSVWVEDEIERGGGGAVEAVADTLEAFFLRWETALVGVGFHVEAFLGDGVLSVGPPPSADPLARQAFEAELAAILARARPPGPARLALGCGSLWRGRVGGWNGRWLALLTGPAVVACHAGLKAAKISAEAAPAPITWNSAALAPRPGKLYEAELADEVCVVACFRDRDARRLVDALEEVAPRLQALADARGGVLEAVTHDDAGVLVRAAFPHDAPGLADALEFAREISRQILARRAPVAVGVAAGKVFRTTAPWASGARTAVQGGAVNRAAKLAKSGRGLRLDSSAQAHCGGRPALRIEPAPDRPQLGALDGCDAFEAFQAAAPPDRGATPPLHIVAEPGFGKSFLLRAFAREPRPDPAVLVAATPQHCGDALWIWARVVEDLAASRPEVEAALAAAPCDQTQALADRLSPVRRGREDTDLGQIAQVILSALKAIPRTRPQLVLLDDLQWADTLSIALLARVVTDCPGVQIVTASRPSQTLSQHELGPQRRLAPLSRDGLSLVLLAAGVTRLDAAALEQIARLSGGAPLFALQLGRHWQETGELPHGGLDEILERRLARLDASARAVLRILALAGQPLAAAEIARVGDRPDKPMRDLLADLCRRGLAEATLGASETFGVAHALIGERALAQTPAGVRPALHARLARRLTVRGVRVGGGEIGAHYAAAGETLRASLRDLRDADAALRGGDYGAALTLYRRAQTLLPADGRADLRRAEAAAGQALSAWGVGRASEAARFAQDALNALDRHLGDGSLRRGAGRRRLIILAGRGGALPARGRAALLRASVARAEAGLFCGDLRSMLAGNLASVRIAARAQGQAQARARGLCTLGLLAGLARLDGPATLAYRAANRLFSGPQAAYSGASEGVWRLAFGQWSQAEACLQRAADQLGAAPNPQLAEVILTLRALAAQFQGRWAQAEALFRKLEADARLSGNHLHTAWGLYGAAMPALQAGRAIEAAAAAEGAYAMLAATGDRQSELICLGVCAQANAKLDRLEAALDFARLGVDLARSMPPLNFGSLEGYAGPAAAALVVAAHPKASPALRAQATSLVPAGLRILTDFARIFPIGRPRLLALRSLAPSWRQAHLAAAAAKEAGRRQMAGEHWGGAWIETARISS